ncbi:hypothetical protein [Citrobacter phage Ci1]|nr:hypothetical protein [Citrobacter phage Ci1]
MNSSLYQHVFEQCIRHQNRPEAEKYMSRWDVCRTRVVNINMGRCTGKTSAILNTMMLNQDYDYFYLGCSMHMASDTYRKFKRDFEHYSVGYPKNLMVFTGNQQSQIRDAIKALRKLDSKRKLVIFVDEPMVHYARIYESISSEIVQSRIDDYVIIFVGEQS